MLLLGASRSLFSACPVPTSQPKACPVPPKQTTTLLPLDSQVPCPSSTVALITMQSQYLLTWLFLPLDGDVPVETVSFTQGVNT